MARDPAVTLYHEENPHEEKSSRRKEFFSPNDFLELPNILQLSTSRFHMKEK